MLILKELKKILDVKKSLKKYSMLFVYRRVFVLADRSFRIIHLICLRNFLEF